MSQVRVVGQAWIANAPTAERDPDNYWADGNACVARLENTDQNEVALHILLDEGGSADASLYLTHQEAFRLAALIGRTLLDDGQE